MEKLREEGRNWYRMIEQQELNPFDERTTGNFSIAEDDQLRRFSERSRSSLPAGRIIVLAPPLNLDNKPLLGLWLKWNFDSQPLEFRIFMGFWSKVEEKKNFFCIRFEAPESESNHDYYHCQICQDFADRGNVPQAACVPKYFPAIPLNASNIVETAVCAIMAVRGRRKTKNFIEKLLADPVLSSNKWLHKAYNKLC